MINLKDVNNKFKRLRTTNFDSIDVDVMVDEVIKILTVELGYNIMDLNYTHSIRDWVSNSYMDQLLDQSIDTFSLEFKSEEEFIKSCFNKTSKYFKILLTSTCLYKTFKKCCDYHGLEVDGSMKNPGELLVKYGREFRDKSISCVPRKNGIFFTWVTQDYFDPNTANSLIDDLYKETMNTLVSDSDFDIENKTKIMFEMRDRYCTSSQFVEKEI